MLLMLSYINMIIHRNASLVGCRLEQLVRIYSMVTKDFCLYVPGYFFFNSEDAKGPSKLALASVDSGSEIW